MALELYYSLAWCLPLVMLAFSTDRTLFGFTLIITILARVSLYFDGVFIGDIKNSYINLTQDFSQFKLEPGYVFLIKLISFFTSSPSTIMYITQYCVITVILTVGIIFTNRANQISLTIAVIMASGFTFLATQNVLRQGFAAPLILLSHYLFATRKYTIGTLLIGVSQIFHFSSILFIILINANDKFLKYLSKKLNIMSNAFSILYIASIICCVAILSYFFFDYIYIAGRNNERFSGYLKPIMVFFYFAITTYLFKRLEKNETNMSGRYHLFHHRILFFSIFFGFSINPILVEVASRILLFCYSIDLYYLLTFKLLRNNGRQLKIWILMNLTWAFNPSIYGLLVQKA